MIQSAIQVEKKREEEERKVWFVENFDKFTLLDIYASERNGETRRNVVEASTATGRGKSDKVNYSSRILGRTGTTKESWMEMTEK